MCRSCSTPRGWSVTCTAVGVADRLDCAAGADHRRVRCAVHRFAGDNGLPWVDFTKGQRKDDVMHQHLARFTGTEGVVFVGRAQEKTRCSAPRSAATPTVIPTRGS